MSKLSFLNIKKIRNWKWGVCFVLVCFVLLVVGGNVFNDNWEKHFSGIELVLAVPFAIIYFLPISILEGILYSVVYDPYVAERIFSFIFYPFLIIEILILFFVGVLLGNCWDKLRGKRNEKQ